MSDYEKIDDHKYLDGDVGKTSGIQRYGPEFDSHIFASGLGITQTESWPYRSCTNTLTFGPMSDDKEKIRKKWT